MVYKNLDETNASLPVNLIAQSEEIANVVFFMASDDAGVITGTTLVVDSGWMVRAR